MGLSTAILVLSSLLTLTSSALAQGQSQEKRHEGKCRLAHQVLTKGQPAVKRDWALGYVSACRELGGEALAAALRSHRTAVARSDELTKLVVSTSLLIDRDVLNAALEVASDPTAGRVARVEAIRILSFQIRPGTFAPYQAFVAPDSALSAPSTVSTGESPVVGEPLPDDAFDRVATILFDLADAPSTPEPVTVAAQSVARQAAAQARDSGG